MDRRFEGIGGAIFMIGIGLIFLLGLEFWPWILAVIAASSVFSAVAHKGLAGLQGPLWLVGIALIVWKGWALFPVILILIGLSSLFKMLSPRSVEAEKPKRDLPDEYEDKPKRGLSLDELLEHGRMSDGEIYEDDERQARSF